MLSELTCPMKNKCYRISRLYNHILCTNHMHESSLHGFPWDWPCCTQKLRSTHSCHNWLSTHMNIPRTPLEKNCGYSLLCVLVRHIFFLRGGEATQCERTYTGLDLSLLGYLNKVLIYRILIPLVTRSPFKNHFVVEKKCTGHLK